MRHPHPRLAPLIALLLGGCQALLSDPPEVECQDDRGCPKGEFCDLRIGRCAIEPDAARGPDAGFADVGVDVAPDAAADVAPPPDASPDAAPDAEADPDAIGDAGAPALRPFGDAAECFESAAGALVGMPRGAAHVPVALCAPEALVWTAVEDGRIVLWTKLGPDAEALPGPTIAGELARTMVDGQVLFVDGSTPPRIMRYDVRGDAPPRPLSDSGLAQSNPVQAPGIAAWVEATAEGSQVVIQPGTGTRGCGRPGTVQWGVAAGADWLAFFERTAPSRRAHLVVTRGHDCVEQRFTLALGGEVREDARVVGGAEELFWIQADAEQRRAVYRISRLRLADGPSPIALASVPNPVDLEARAHWLAVVGYRAGGHNVVLVDRRPGGDTLEISPVGNGLRPSLSPSYLTWARQIAAEPWEVRYARLDDR